MDSNDDTTRHCVRGTRCDQVLEPWAGVILKDDDVGHTLSASNYMNNWGITFGEQGCGLSMKASTTRSISCLGNKRLAPGAVVTLAKGGSQLALDYASRVPRRRVPLNYQRQ